MSHSSPTVMKGLSPEGRRASTGGGSFSNELESQIADALHELVGASRRAAGRQAVPGLGGAWRGQIEDLLTEIAIEKAKRRLVTATTAAPLSTSCARVRAPVQSTCN